MKITHFKIIVLLIILTSCKPSGTNQGFHVSKVLPTPAQVEYQQMELIGFIHYSINTFTDKEWGYGDESPSLFNPSQNDPEQWVLTAKKAGMKQLILTAKHHDGYCLWPSQYTEHSIKYSPYKNGKGDIVREFTDACRKHGLKAGLYLSPWDRNHAAYGEPAYVEYYRNQLRELLTDYGPISEIWFDGANGGDGYYGGARETRHIDRQTYYDWDRTFALVKQLQPGIMIFSDAGPDVHWIGNEHGFAGETFWSTISPAKLTIGQSKTDYLNRGEPEGTHWIVGQCDVSIRPGWFYHESQDSLVKSPRQLVDIYYKSVGRNALLLLNLPPDRRGLIHDNDLGALHDFRSILDETFSQNLVRKATLIPAGDNRAKNNLPPGFASDDRSDTFWTAVDSIGRASILLQWEETQYFDRLMLCEPVRYGQKVTGFTVEIHTGSHWETITHGTTIGMKRLLRFEPVQSDQLRISLQSGSGTAALSEIGVYKASPREFDR